MDIQTLGGITYLKVEFFIEAIYYHSENPIPSVVIAVRNKVDDVTDKTLFADNREDMHKALRDLFLDATKIHKTSFMISLEKYRESAMMVGDRLEVDLTIKNNGEITQ